MFAVVPRALVAPRKSAVTARSSEQDNLFMAISIRVTYADILETTLRQGRSSTIGMVLVWITPLADSAMVGPLRLVWLPLVVSAEMALPPVAAVTETIALAWLAQNRTEASIAGDNRR
jgi:hypothetical protein